MEPVSRIGKNRVVYSPDVARTAPDSSVPTGTGSVLTGDSTRERVLQVVLIATGVLVPSMFVIGVLCALAWWYAVVKGGAMDRENVRRAEEQRRWEVENPLT